MIDPSLKPPEALMRAIAADLKPVRPSPRPLRLALLTVPHALVVSSLVLWAIGIRGDSSVLGPLLTWGHFHASRPSRQLPDLPFEPDHSFARPWQGTRCS